MISSESTRLAFVLALVAQVLLLGCGSANGASATPEGTAAKFLTAMSEQKFDLAAELMHSDALKQYRDQFLEDLIALNRGQPVRDTKELSIPGIGTMGELKGLSLEKFFVHIYSSLASKLSPGSPVGTLGANVSGNSLKVLGSVMEGASDAHVVFRWEEVIYGKEVFKVTKVLSLRLEGNEWKVLLWEEITKQLAIMRAVWRKP